VVPSRSTHNVSYRNTSSRPTPTWITSPTRPIARERSQLGIDAPAGACQDNLNLFIVFVPDTSKQRRPSPHLWVRCQYNSLTPLNRSCFQPLSRYSSAGSGRIQVRIFVTQQVQDVHGVAVIAFFIMMAFNLVGLPSRVSGEVCFAGSPSPGFSNCPTGLYCETSSERMCH